MTRPMSARTISGGAASRATSARDTGSPMPASARRRGATYRAVVAAGARAGATARVVDADLQSGYSLPVQQERVHVTAGYAEQLEVAHLLGVRPDRREL